MSNPQPKAPTSQLVFPNAENTTTNQLQNLLQIGSFALHAMIRPDQQGVPRPDTFPKEAEIAAENTFIKVMETFDSLLAEKDRWTLDTQKQLQARFDEAHALNLKYLAHQEKFAQEMNTPHFRFKPALLRLHDGRMLALLGNVEDLDNAIVGLGESAEEALRKFDETFEHGVPRNVAEYLQKREADLEAGKTPEQYPIQKNEQTHTDEKMDSRRVKSARKSRKSGEK